MITVLAGGVGAAKLIEGLAAVMISADLAVIGNPGDDVELHGLFISPDLDIVTYTLAGIVDPAKGWGIAGDTFEALAALGRLGEETWFRLGDRDIATHLFRTRLLRGGARPTDVARAIAERLGVRARILPPTDDTVRTEIRTPGGNLTFQEFFVRQGCRPEILDVRYRGGEASAPTPEALEAIEEADVILIAPSNPIASIGPILAVPGIREALERHPAPRLAVSPIVAGRSLKGPSDRMLRAKGFEASPRGVAKRYEGLIDGIVIDRADEGFAGELRANGLAVLVAETVMKSREDKSRLARACLEFAGAYEWTTA